MKNFILLSLCLFIFLGNIGVPIYTHACEKEGVFTSFFINQQNHCPNKPSNLPPCCQKKKNKSCCHDEKTILKLEEKFTQTSHSVIPFLMFDFLLKTNLFQGYHDIFSDHKSTFSPEDPPPLTAGKPRKTLLVKNCIFRI